MRGIPLIIVLVFLGSFLSSPVAAAPAAEIEPELESGQVVMCDGQAYTVMDAVGGVNYAVWVLEMVAGSLVRVGWNNQLPQTQKAVTIEMDNGPTTFSDTTVISQTGECGMFGPFDNGARPGFPNAYTVTASFSGLTTTITNSQSHTTETNYWSSARLQHHSEGRVTLTDAGVVDSWEQEISFGSSTTETLQYGTQVTQTSTLHVFSQPYAGTW